MLKNKIPDKWFYIAIVLLVVYLIVRLVNQYGIVEEFPLDASNDHSAHMSQVYFLYEYGFGNTVTNWYTYLGGYPLLKYYHPARSYLSLLFYYLLGSVEAAVYFSMISIIILGFLSIYYLGKLHGLSKIKRVAFFLFFFASPLMIGYYRVGRQTEILGLLWMILFIFIILWYKHHKIDKYFMWFIPVYALLLLSHISVFLVSSPLILSLLLIKKNRERIIIILSGIVSFILTSFWSIPFILGLNDVFIGDFYGLKRTLLPLFTMGDIMDKVSSFIVPLIFILIFYFYYRTAKKENDLVFYSVPIIIGVLLMTRLLIFVPYLNRPLPDTHNMLFLFLSIYLFFRIDFDKLSNIEKKMIKYGLIIVPIMGIIISLSWTSFYEGHTQENKDITSLFPYVDGDLIIIGIDGYARPYYSYGAVYYNISTPFGWGEQSVSLEAKEPLADITEDFTKKDCDLFLKDIRFVGGKEIITKGENCGFLIGCGMKIETNADDYCLLKDKP